MVLLDVVCTNAIHVAIIFKAVVDVMQGVHVPFLALDQSVQFPQKDDKFEFPCSA